MLNINMFLCVSMEESEYGEDSIPIEKFQHKFNAFDVCAIICVSFFCAVHFHFHRIECEKSWKRQTKRLQSRQITFLLQLWNKNQPKIISSVQHRKIKEIRQFSSLVLLQNYSQIWGRQFYECFLHGKSDSMCVKEIEGKRLTSFSTKMQVLMALNTKYKYMS